MGAGKPKDLTTPTAVEKVMAPDAGPAIIDFWADWCQPCKMMAPHFAAVAEAYAEEKVSFYKINSEKFPLLAQAFNVRSLPTTVFVHNGEVLDVAVGMLTERKLTKKTEWLIGKSEGKGFFSNLLGRNRAS